MTETIHSTGTDITEVVDAHLRAYGESDPDRRRALVEQAWSPEGTLVDPPLDPATGHAAIDGMFAAVQSLYPDHRFRRVTPVDAHHGFGRYGWEMVRADGTVALAGTDVVELAADGRLAGVVGFFGELERELPELTA